MTADTYTFYSPSAGDWVTKCAECGAWWLAGSGDGWHVCATATLVPVARDPHPSEGCGLCGWDGVDDPCPSHAAEVTAWNARHGVTA